MGYLWQGLYKTMHSASAIILFLLLLSKDAVASGFDDDSDLATYVTRPELRAPLFDVTTHKPESVSPGYWFTAPYASLYGEVSSERYETCQVGPHIYDQEGNLVWSGACLVKNRPTCDFRVTSYYDSPSLSMVLAPDPREEEDDPRGVGWIMDDAFELHKTVHMHDMIPSFNMHEFNILDNGGTALVVTKDPKFDDIPIPDSDDPDPEEINVQISHNGFQEIDILTGYVLFEWDAVDHIPLNESLIPLDVDNPDQLWDYIHLNSVDKSSEGDYLISGRHTSAIYKVSKDDGSIIWQLGGLNSSFEQIGFEFSYQHDARFQAEEGSVTIISYLNNASDRETETAEYSTAQLVRLDTDSMTATLISEWGRPDHNLTRLRGNVQILENGTTFVGWSDNSYISEFTPDGELAIEAQFLSDRFATYRTYKFNFTGLPQEPPVLKSFAYGTNTSADATSTVSYVSWNGATEVVSWNFYASASDASTADFTFLGNTNRTGFETMFTVGGYMRYVMAEALDKDGNVLDNSPVEETELPSNWVSESSDSAFDKNLFEASVEAIKGWVSGGDTENGTVTTEEGNTVYAGTAEVRIPLPVFILFFCLCALGTILGVGYSLRHRITWLNGKRYRKISDDRGNEMEAGSDLEKFELEEEDVQRGVDCDTADSASETDR